MEHGISHMIDTIHAMEKQLRQDFLYMLVKGLPPLYSSLPEVNRYYRFHFPEGSFCMLLLHATPRIQGDPVRQDWLEAAKAHMETGLQDISGDFEILILDATLYCLVGSPLPREVLTDRFHRLFDALGQLNRTYTCAWTMGLGRYVTQIPDIPQTLSSAQHAIKYSIRDGIEKLYDGNLDCIIYEGGLTMMTPSEQVALKRLIQKPDEAAMTDGIRRLFREKAGQIEKYPVYAYMLALQISNISIQTLRELMPVDRQTYELSLKNEKQIDQLTTLEDLIEHTISGVLALCRRYQMFLSSGKSQPIWLAITYIQEHYREPITLEALSRVADRNPQYISAVFSKTCGMSLKEYITSLRVEEAKGLLRASGMSVGEIALHLGYQDAKYFSRIFRNATGCSPRGYRNSSEQPRQGDAHGDFLNFPEQ